MAPKATAKYDLSGALKRHLDGLKTHLEYLKLREAEAKNRTAHEKPVYTGRIIEVEKEIEHLEQVLQEG